jgi:hypothetical protein
MLTAESSGGISAALLVLGIATMNLFVTES